MSSVSAFYWFLKCTSPGASGGFAPLTPTGALPLDPTRGPWAGPWTPGRKALATLACSLRIAESDFWDFNVGRYVYQISRKSAPKGRHIYVYHVNVRTPPGATSDKTKNWRSTCSAMSDKTKNWHSTCNAMSDKNKNWHSTSTAMSDKTKNWLSTCTATSDKTKNWRSTSIAMSDKTKNWLSTSTAMSDKTKNWRLTFFSEWQN